MNAPNCNCCGTPMILKSEPAPMLKCSNCKQEVYPGINNEINMIVLPKLYPSHMQENSKIYDEFLDYRIAEITFDARARVCFGSLTNTEADERVEQITKMVAEKRAELRNARPWWRRAFQSASHVYGPSK